MVENVMLIRSIEPLLSLFLSSIWLSSHIWLPMSLCGPGSGNSERLHRGSPLRSCHLTPKGRTGCCLQPHWPGSWKDLLFHAFSYKCEGDALLFLFLFSWEGENSIRRRGPIRNGTNHPREAWKRSNIMPDIFISGLPVKKREKPTSCLNIPYDCHSAYASLSGPYWKSKDTW